MLMISSLYIVLLTAYVSFLNELIVNLANRVSHRNNVTHSPISLKKLRYYYKAYCKYRYHAYTNVRATGGLGLKTSSLTSLSSSSV